MRAIKKINNNVVTCIDDDGNELIAMGRGLGFGELPRGLKLSEISRTFYDVGSRYLSAAGDLPEEVLEFAAKIVDVVRNQLPYELSPNLTFILADHIAYAVERARKQMYIRMPMAYDVQQSYPDEYRLGSFAVRRIEKEFGVRLPREEAAGIALNLVNAQMSTEEIRASETTADDRILEDVTEIIEALSESPSTARHSPFLATQRTCCIYSSGCASATTWKPRAWMPACSRACASNSPRAHHVQTRSPATYSAHGGASSPMMRRCTSSSTSAGSARSDPCNPHRAAPRTRSRNHAPTRRMSKDCYWVFAQSTVPGITFAASPARPIRSMNCKEFDMKYEQLCNDILQIISTDNIQDVFCCITRLRLIVKDKSIIDREQLEAIEGVLQVKEMGNQIQLVIGTHVPDVYREFCSITGFKEKDVIDDDDEQPTGEKAPISSMILETLSSIFLPVLPAFCTGGMIKSLVLILTTFGSSLVTAESPPC